MGRPVITVKYHVFLFDLDDTLIEIADSYTFFDNIIIEVFNKYSIKPPSSKDRDLLWRNTDYKKLLTSWNFPDHQLFWKTFDEIDFIKRRELLHKGLINVYEDVEPFFKSITTDGEIISVIITNTTQEIAEYELNHFNIVKYFYRIYGLGETQELCKPSPDGINMILDELNEECNFEKSDVFIIGDSENDIIAGEQAGINTIFLNRTNRDVETIAHYSINSLEELIQVIKIYDNK